MLNPAVVLDGRVIGTWRRTLGRAGVAVELSLFRAPGPRERRALSQAARRYGAFLGLARRLTITVTGSSRTAAARMCESTRTRQATAQSPKRDHRRSTMRLSAMLLGAIPGAAARRLR